RLRIWTLPTTAAPSASAVYRARIRGSAAISVIAVRAPITRPPPASAIEASRSRIRLTSITSGASIEPSRNPMIRSVPPARRRAAGSPARSSMASLRSSGWAIANARIRTYEDPLDLVQQHLRVGGAHEVVRPVAEAMDEGGPCPAKLVGVDERHRDARCQELVEQEVVLERVERLELPLERDQLDRRWGEVAVDRREDHDVDAGGVVLHLRGRQLAEDLRDLRLRRGLVGSLGALRAALEKGLFRAHDRDAVAVDDGRLGRDQERPSPAGLDLAHRLAVVRFPAQEQDRAVAVANPRGMEGV